MSEEQVYSQMKTELLKTHNQKKRRKILEDYKDQFHTDTFLVKYERLKSKANQKVSILKYGLIWGTILYLPCWPICYVGFGYLDWLESTSGVAYALGMLGALIFLCTALWCLVGIPALIVMLFIFIKARKKPNYYLNIKDI